MFYDEQGFVCYSTPPTQCIEALISNTWRVGCGMCAQSAYYVLAVNDYEVLDTSPPASEAVQLPADELDRQPLPAALPPRRPKHQNPGSW